MEVEQNHQVAFLDVLVSRVGNCLNPRVYRKATNTDRYFHKLSNHHPSQKQETIKTLTDSARKICGPQHLTTELQHLEKAFRQNGYSQWDIKRAVEVGLADAGCRKSEPTRKDFLPFVPRVTDSLKKNDIKIYKPTTTI